MTESKINQLAEQYSAAGKFSPLALFSKKQFEIAAIEQLSPRPYYHTRKGLFYFCVVSACICQIASALSAYSFFEFVLRVKLSGYYLIGCTVAVLLLIELAKYYLFNTLFADLFRLSGAKPDFGIIVVSLIVSGISIFASVHGGGILATDYSAETTIEKRFDERKAAIKQEIDAIIKRNTWKGSTWLSKADKELLKKKESFLQAEREAEQAAQQQAREKNETNAAIYRYGFAAFEVVFIIATLFVWFFRKRVAIESEAAAGVITRQPVDSVAQEEPQRLAKENTYYSPDKPRKANPIGFQFAWQQPAVHETQPEPEKESGSNAMRNNAMRMQSWQQGTCAHCSSPFTKRTTWHKYCKPECKVAAWEARTGKTFKKHKKQLDLF